MQRTEGLFIVPLHQNQHFETIRRIVQLLQVRDQLIDY
jgi:hypothetical protein